LNGPIPSLRLHRSTRPPLRAPRRGALAPPSKPTDHDRFVAPGFTRPWAHALVCGPALSDCNHPSDLGQEASDLRFGRIPCLSTVCRASGAGRTHGLHLAAPGPRR
jgi:hypothetical protein